jgi:hypothetical protein
MGLALSIGSPPTTRKSRRAWIGRSRVFCSTSRAISFGGRNGERGRKAPMSAASSSPRCSPKHPNSFRSSAIAIFPPTHARRAIRRQFAGLDALGSRRLGRRAMAGDQPHPLLVRRRRAERVRHKTALTLENFRQIQQHDTKRSCRTNGWPQPTIPVWEDAESWLAYPNDIATFTLLSFQ